MVGRRVVDEKNGMILILLIDLEFGTKGSAAERPKQVEKILR